MADLYALVYVSTATAALDTAQIDRLLDRAQQRNARAGLTGVLLFDGGCFMQYVEGSAQEVGRVYSSIKASPLHSGIVELMREPIERREFPQWSMAFRSVNAFGMSHPAPRADVLAPLPEHPDAESTSVARSILTRFWNRSRSAHAF